MKTLLRIHILFLILSVWTAPLQAESCRVENQGCTLKILEEEAGKIENTRWRDQTYRELVKTLASFGETDKALSFIAKIETPDTQAMAIRGIGMEAAKLNLDRAAYDALFSKLHVQAQRIEHPPSFAIALTYIAMAQAFAKDNEGAWDTASRMENDALRHKAYGETAEIQAEYGDTAAAMKSISFIQSTAFQNKAYALVSKILAQRGQYQDAFDAAVPITNAYKKAQALQYILNAQTSAKDEAVQ